MKEIVLATRGSLLAMAQAAEVQRLLEAEGVKVKIRKVTTRGDLDREHALRQIGGNGLFMREIEKELVEGRADIAVHSGKDLPYEISDSLVIAGIPKAADGRDCLVCLKGKMPRKDTDFYKLGAIGTGSARRISQLRALCPSAEFKEIRGNINTRLEKLRRGEYGAIVLAKAGLDRLHPDMTPFDVRIFSTDAMIPACTQGILAVECRRDDEETIRLLQKISDEPSKKRFEAERFLFTEMKADCTKAVGIYTQLSKDGSRLQYKAVFEGRTARRTGSYDAYRQLSREICEKIYPDADSAAGTVTLVGAGCGRDLITVSGLHALQKAQTVVYDDLIDPKLVSSAPADARKIYVGKRYGKHSRTQEQINQILIEEAAAGRDVVRLKGGDSFVFGRGGEEYLALEAAGIPCRVIPGVSSAIAVPEQAGIPVTHRKVSRSFTVVTGHTADGTGENFEALARLGGTLVFLMGLHAYPQITQRLIACGKDPNTPAAVLSKGFSPDEKRIDGTLETIAQQSKKAEAPAILVIGQTALFHMTDTSDRPLAGARVTVTGTLSFTRRMQEKLESLGAWTDTLPTLRICPHEEAVPSDLSPYQWLVFTSSNGVEIFFDALAHANRDLRELARLKFACIGKGTEQKLLSHGFHADFIPTKYTSEVLGKELSEMICTEQDGTGAVHDERVLILRAENGSPALTRALDAAHVHYDDVKIYSTDTADAQEGLPPCDYLIFSSASGVRSIFSQDALRAEIRRAGNMTPVCIGEVTAEELKKHTQKPFLVAASYTMDGIAQVIEKDWT